MGRFFPLPPGRPERQIEGDARTLRKFAKAYVVPVGLPLVGKAAASLLTSLFFSPSELAIRYEAAILPPERPFLTAEWRYLAMLQYEVDPAVLRPLVPRGTELDLWQGRALVSVVGFRFLETRILGAPIPFHRHFDEVNLRFYVRRMGPEGPRRAVVFIREIVPRRAIALVARLCYNEPYVALPMRHTIAMDGAEDEKPGRVRYEWLYRGEWAALEVETRGPPARPAAGSEEEFISEHYWGYTAQRDGSSLEYRVAHLPWRTWAVERVSLRCDAERLYGPSFARGLTGLQRSAFLADGSGVAVFRGRRLGRDDRPGAR